MKYNLLIKDLDGSTWTLSTPCDSYDAAWAWAHDQFGMHIRVTGGWPE